MDRLVLFNSDLISTPPALLEERIAKYPVDEIFDTAFDSVNQSGGG